MAANTVDLAKLIKQWITPEIAAFGLTIPEFYIENVSLPDAVEKALDKRTSMGIVGDLGQFMQYSTAEALSQGGPAAQGMLTGMGAGMGMGMAGQMLPGPWGTRPMEAVERAPQPELIAAAPPPPPPVDRVWHVAENGQTKGPFSRAELGRMVTDGTVGREVLRVDSRAGWLDPGRRNSGARSALHHSSTSAARSLARCPLRRSDVSSGGTYCPETCEPWRSKNTDFPVRPAAQTFATSPAQSS